MSVIESLDVRAGLAYGDFNRGLADVSRQLDDFEARTKSRFAAIEVPAPKLDAGGIGREGSDALRSSADSAAASFTPLAGLIRQSLGAAVAPLAQFAARFSAQFDRVGATVQLLAIRIDDSMRFPQFVKRAEGLRDAIKKLTGDASADFARLGAAIGREADASKLVGTFVDARQAIRKAVEPIPRDVGYALEAAGHVDARAGFKTFLAGLDEVSSEAIDKMKAMADAVASATGKGSRKAKWKARDQAADLAATHAAAPPVENFTAATARFRPPPVASFWPPALEQVIGRATAQAGGFAKALNLDVANGMNAVRKAAQPAKDAVFLIGKAATSTIDAFLGFKKVGNVLSGLGSVAGATWKKLSIPLPKLSFDPKQSTILKGIGGAADSAAGSLKNLGAQAAIALGIFGLAYKAVSFIKDGVVNAANLNETLDKTDAVLGSASAGVKRFAEDLGVQFGLVQQDTLDTAAGFGGLFKGLGGQSGAALEKSTKDFTKLAADLGSFANMSMKEAGDSLRIALSGEVSDRLKQIGVVTDEATVKAYAYSHGIAKVGAELSNQQKLTARAGVIMDGLKDAQDNLNQTSGSTANQFRALTGKVTNLGASIGSALLPAVNGVLGLFNKLGSWAISAFDSAKTSVGAFVDKIVVGFDYVEAAINNPKAAFEVFRLTAIQALANIGEYAETLGPNIAIVAGYVADNWMLLLGDAFDWTVNALKNLLSNFEKVGKAIVEWLQNPTQGFHVDWTPLSDGFEATAAKFPELIKPHLTDMSREIAAAAKPIADAVQAKADRAKAAADAAAKRAAAVAGLEAKGEKAGASEIEKFAKKLSESTMTPLEEFREQVGKIREAFGKKLITEEVGQRGLAEAEAKLHGDGPKFAGALQAGSADARSAILAALTGRGKDAVADNTRTLVNQGNAGNGLLGRIAASLEKNRPAVATI